MQHIFKWIQYIRNMLSSSNSAYGIVQEKFSFFTAATVNRDGTDSLTFITFTTMKQGADVASHSSCAQCDHSVSI